MIPFATAVDHIAVESEGQAKTWLLLGIFSPTMGVLLLIAWGLTAVDVGKF
jgi:hypothetical protein